MPAVPAAGSIRILFVCLGNICRSPAAEEVMRSLAEAAGQKHIVTDSAGLIDFHEGELPDVRMRRAADRRGYRLTHRSRPVGPADFKHFDIIAAMDERNRTELLRIAENEQQRAKVVRTADFLTTHTEHSFIPDPYYGREDDFDLVITLLEDACATLLEQLKR